MFAQSRPLRQNVGFLTAAPLYGTCPKVRTPKTYTEPKTNNLYYNCIIIGIQLYDSGT